MKKTSVKPVERTTLNPYMSEDARCKFECEIEQCRSLCNRLREKNLVQESGITEKELSDVIKRAGQRITETLESYRNAILVPNELLYLQMHWIALQTKHGDEGTCVLGAYFEFDYKGQHYKMPPAGPHQGSLSWECSKDEIAYKLNELGAENITYEWGNMD